MSAQDLEHRARELLAAEYERERCPNSAAAVRNNDAVEVDTDIAIRAIAAALRQQPAPAIRDRELDRKHFTDASFNEWLDTGISDAGHTVWDAIGDTQAAWAGWDARPFAGDAVMLSECCGSEECGSECGNAWLGVRMYRKPIEQPAAVVDDAMREDSERLDWLDANGFTAYRSIDPIDGLSCHFVVVHETMKPRRGNVADTIRKAIDLARAQGVRS